MGACGKKLIDPIDASADSRNDDDADVDGMSGLSDFSNAQTD